MDGPCQSSFILAQAAGGGGGGDSGRAVHVTGTMLGRQATALKHLRHTPQASSFPRCKVRTFKKWRMPSRKQAATFT